MGLRLDCLRSDFFKIVLKGLSQDHEVPESDAEYSNPSMPSRCPEFFIHKTLLASLSPELDKHTNNHMREGREGVMELSDVDEATVEALLEWAYLKDYTIPLEQSSSAAALLYHTKTYVLADRFNITILKDLCYSKISTILKKLGVVTGEDDVNSVLAAATFAFENLPVSSVGSETISAPTEILLQYFTGYISWSLDAFRPSPKFRKALVMLPDFAEALVCSSSAATMPPWITAVDSSSATGAALKLFTPFESTHQFSRVCSNCNYQGIMNIICASCQTVDDEIGTVVELGGITLGVIGDERLFGTQTSYEYTCKWCDHKRRYDSTQKAFKNWYGDNYTVAAHTGHLACRKCTKQGYAGSMSLII